MTILPNPRPKIKPNPETLDPKIPEAHKDLKRRGITTLAHKFRCSSRIGVGCLPRTATPKGLGLSVEALGFKVKDSWLVVQG